MAITRLTAPSITGLTIPNTSINNASLNSVSALPSGIDTGKVGQVVQASANSGNNSSSSSFTNTACAIEITPTATSSKVLVMMTFGYKNPQHNQAFWTIYRGSTNLGNSNDGLVGSKFAGGETRAVCSMNYLDSPSTTSTISYNVYQKSVNTSTITMNPDSSNWTAIAIEILA
jgi:hypothetical protein